MRRPILMLHIMKTAGTSLRRMLVESMGWDAVYPNDRDLKQLPKRWYPGPQALVDHAQRDDTHGARVLIGHLPYAVTYELRPRPITVALLRDPIARAVSMLEHRRRLTPHLRGLSLEALLDDATFVDRQIRDYQTKTFAFDAIGECPEHVNVPLDIDRERFERARQRLDSLDVIGVTERMTTFATQFTNATGIRIGEQRADNRGAYEPAPLSVELHTQLSALTSKDAILYSQALELIQSRSPTTGAKAPTDLR